VVHRHVAAVSLLTVLLVGSVTWFASMIVMIARRR
jgi:hypothetical protein